MKLIFMSIHSDLYVCDGMTCMNGNLLLIYIPYIHFINWQMQMIKKDLSDIAQTSVFFSEI